MSLHVSQLTYEVGSERLLDIPEYEFLRGSVTVIKGPSGAGKSTLLYGLAGIDVSAGRLKLDGHEVDLSSAKKRDVYRQKNIGLVFQNIHLLAGLSIIDNVLLPFSFSQLHVSKPQRLQAIQLLNLFGFHQVNRPVDMLSRGEKQRVAIARALVSNPDIVLADEPTASLDASNSEAVIEQLKQCSRENKIVIATSHDPLLQAAADLLLTIERGVIK